LKSLIPGILVIIVISLFINCRPPEVEATVLAMNRGQSENAYRYAQMAIEKYPENAEAWFYWGWLNGEYKKDYDEMNRAFAKTIAINPVKKMAYTDTTITISESINRLRNKFYVEHMNPAIQAVKNARKLPDNNPDRSKLINDAIEGFLNAKYIDPSRIETYAPLTQALILAADTANAVKTIRTAIEAHPQNVELQLLAGDIFAVSGDEYMAKIHYAKAAGIHYQLYSKPIEIEPEEVSLSSNIALSLYENRQFKEAIPYFVNVIESVPEDQEAYKFLSDCYIQSNMPDEGIPFLEKTVNLYPNEPLFWEYLSLLYAQKGMSDQADAAHQKYKSLKGEL
jgi:tetratricopeptide (TPR) repeat protein